MKKVMAFLILLFSGILFMGCASVTSSLIVFSDGMIQEKLIIEVDYGSLQQNGFSEVKVAELMGKIQSEIYNNFEIPASNFKQYAKDSITNTELKEKIKNEFSCTRLFSGGTVTLVTSYPDVGVFNAYQSFLATGTVSAGMSNTQQPNQVIHVEEGLFTTKYITDEAISIFSGIQSQKVQQIITDIQVVLNGRYGLNNVKLFQIFASPDQKIRSNANVVEDVEDLRFHEWHINPTNPNVTLQFFKLRATETTWYVLAVVLTVVTMAVFIYYSVYYTQFKQQKKKNAEEKKFGMKFSETKETPAPTGVVLETEKEAEVIQVEIIEAGEVKEETVLDENGNVISDVKIYNKKEK